jgi:hypothetical protein
LINEKEVALSLLWVASIGIASGSLDTDKIDQVTGLKGRPRGLLVGGLLEGQFAASRLNAAFYALLPRKGKK